MPSQTLTAALLVLGNTEGLPWTTPEWQTITKVHGVPWNTEVDAPETGRSPNVAEWTNQVANKVQQFAEKVWSMAGNADKQDSFVTTKKADNVSEGRLSWAQFVKDQQGRWGINCIIDEVLYEAGQSPYQIMRELETRKVSQILCVDNIHSRLCTATDNRGSDGYGLPEGFGRTVDGTGRLSGQEQSSEARCWKVRSFAFSFVVEPVPEDRAT